MYYFFIVGILQFIAVLTSRKFSILLFNLLRSIWSISNTGDAIFNKKYYVMLYTITGFEHKVMRNLLYPLLLIHPHSFPEKFLFPISCHFFYFWAFFSKNGA